jgi:cobalt-zinc-cadmium efflux system protein
MSGDAHAHDEHGHGHGHSSMRELQRRALWIALAANGGFLVVEVIGGFAFDSLALLADAAHMLSDVVALAIALGAQALMVRPATRRHSYGFQRAEVLGGQINGIALVAAAGWIAYEAIGRLGDPVEVQGGGLIVVATLGLAVNLVSAVLLARARGRSVNMQGAYLHMLVDALGSVGAIAAAIAVIGWDANWADPAISLGVAVLVVWSAWGLLRDTTNMLLEAAPADVRLDDVEAALLEDPAVRAVHHLHLWSLASDVTAFSAHVVLDDVASLHDAQAEGDRLKAGLAQRFDIRHATLELECHPCGPTDVPADPDCR